jgi:flagellar basal body rod protein FlgB
MQSQQLNLDVISNNLANVNTTGFKKSKIEFQDLLYQTYRAPGSDQGGGNLLPMAHRPRLARWHGQNLHHRRTDPYGERLDNSHSGRRLL